jgi:acetyl esterase/lipase
MENDETIELRDLIRAKGSQWSAGMAATFINLCARRQRAQRRVPEGVKVQKTVKYGADARHRVDLYYPADTAANRPVVVYIHGGGFSRGDNDLRFDPHDTSDTPFNGNIGRPRDFVEQLFTGAKTE